tara:strand:+ start:200 stop:1081 length:882 start_codon:yes stop_codon:yes gene_type:complete
MNKGTHEYVSDPRNKEIKISINGEFFEREEAKISVFDSGFLLGDGVWEGIRLHNRKLCFLDEHLTRLYDGAKSIDMKIGKTVKEMKQEIENVLNVNKMEDGVHLRLIVSRGIKATPYQDPKVTISDPTIVIIPEYKKSISKDGLSLISVDIKRGTSETQDPRINSLSKHNCIQACIAATEAGGDEALMLDRDGNVSTCNSTNFFMIKDNEVWTSTGKYCLPGITRKNIIEICKENRIKIYEKNFNLEDTYDADEAFVTGTFAGIITVSEIDGHAIEGDKITSEIRKMYEQRLR